MALTTILMQGRSDGTSNVTFEVLIINFEVDFINSPSSTV